MWMSIEDKMVHGCFVTKMSLALVYFIIIIIICNYKRAGTQLCLTIKTTSPRTRKTNFSKIMALYNIRFFFPCAAAIEDSSHV
ncbi:hypothetical protein OIU76_021962 [Salix suchowensis]|nr:hypothetical protein OIU76_021962 [Salix suchowensis]